MKVGFIGLGNMGQHMATRVLDAGYELVVHDRNLPAQEALVKRGAKGASSAKEVADFAELVLCSLPMPQIVEAVITGTDGVYQGRAVKVVVDLSTTGRSKSLAIQKHLAAAKIGFLDAPVSGGSVGAAAGSLTIMTAGDKAVLDFAQPVLDAIGKKFFHIGPNAGDAQTMKLVNNMLAAANIVAGFEALVMSAKAGLDPKMVLDVINVSSGRNYATMEKFPQSILDRSFPTRFATELLHKDVKLGLEEAEAMGVPMWTLPVVRQFLAFAISQGDGALDFCTGIKHFERWAGAEFGSKTPS